ncbi:hypothetical protein ACFFQW_34680 [Umezawaea endophytica]|uniref:Membrane protein (TIGR02234 family) n=1 Tax=Umezawaea endophytica TaxID=1654476 RepID=A0A9X2VSE8_9PSEU|nr:hypothetical protein [Umezawaea endophytica]MCS7481895.1 hypothetical protein [Umezawaea endophytica]
MRRVVGGIALGAGAALAAVGATLPVFVQVLSFTGDQETFTMTLWGFESSVDVQIDDVGGVRYGVPVVVAAVLLAVSAVLVLAAPRLPARFAGPTSVAAIGSAAVLTGSVWTVGQLVLVASSREDTTAVTSSAGSGMATLVVACVVALAGGVLAQHWPGQASVARPEPTGVVVYRLPDEDLPEDPEGTGGGGS